MDFDDLVTGLERPLNRVRKSIVVVPGPTVSGREFFEGQRGSSENVGHVQRVGCGASLDNDPSANNTLANGVAGN